MTQNLTHSFPLLAALVSWMVFPTHTLHATPSSPPRVLILDETVMGGITSLESVAAQLAIPGCAVDVVKTTNWYAIPASGLSGPTGFGFDEYRAIIIGDNHCQNAGDYAAAMNALNVTQGKWTPACAGNVIIEGVDNVSHYGFIGAEKTLKRGIAFAVNDPARTGFYYAMSCFYETGTNAVPVRHLATFGKFMARGYGANCFDAAHLVATIPQFTSVPPLTDAELSGWNCATHEGFDVWPPSFTVLAIALTNGVFTANDGSNGVPYILVRGEGVNVIGPITLGPAAATNALGTTHTVCATLSTNVTPHAGVPVTFTIASGPNSVTNYTTPSGSNGVACFTYTGNGGPGLDYLTAKYTNGVGDVLSSGTVTKLWEGACAGIGCPELQCVADGTWIYNFCVTNLNSNPLTRLSLSNAPAGVGFTPGELWLSPPLGPGQRTNLTVTISGPITLTNMCFKFGAFTTNEVVLECSIPQCFALPACCNRILTNSLTFISTVGLVSTYNYSITIQNVTGAPLNFAGFGADQSCVTFVPALVDFTLPAYGGPSLLLPGQTRVFNVQVQRTAPCPGTNTFHLSTFDTNFIACCSTKVTLPPAGCLEIVSPYNGSIMLFNTALSARAISTGPCGLRWVKFYDGATELGPATASTGGYNFTLIGLAPGVHMISAVAELDSGNTQAGEIETSAPVELTVWEVPPDHEHNPPAIAVDATGSTILISLPTASGHQYAVEFRTNLAAGGWSTLQNITGDGSVMVITDSMTNDTSRFYRAVQLP